MKILPAILFLPLALSANAAQVYFNLGDFTTRPVQNRVFRMTPVSTPSTSGGATIIGEPLTTNTGNGIFYISNVVANYYDCTVTTPVKPTTFRILIPSTNGVVDSSAVRVTVGTVSGTYDTATSDARYVRVSSGVTNNQFTTNIPGTDVAGSVLLGGLLNVADGQFLFNPDGTADLGGGSIRIRSAAATANAILLFKDGSASFAGGITNTATVATNTAVNIQALTGQATNLLSIRDAYGNIIGLVSSNGVYRTTNDFTATLTTSDNTTNVIYSFTPLANSAVRVTVDIVGYNSISSASYGKTATFKNVAGTVTQVAGTSTTASAEDDTAFESLIDLSGTTVRVRVAGNTAKTVNWVATGKLIYSQ